MNLRLPHRATESVYVLAGAVYDINYLDGKDARLLSSMVNSAKRKGTQSFYARNIHRASNIVWSKSDNASQVAASIPFDNSIWDKRYILVESALDTLRTELSLRWSCPKKNL